MEQSPWEAFNRTQLVKKFPPFMEPEGLSSHIRKTPPFVRILSQMNPIHTTPPYFSNTQSNILPSTPRCSKWTLPLRFSTHFVRIYHLSKSWDNSLSKWLSCGLDARSSIRGRGRDFSLCHHVQTVLGPNQPPVRCSSATLSPAGDTHLHPVPMLRMRGAVSPPTYFMAWYLIKYSMYLHDVVLY
jgi:hypothetical protein